MKIYAALRQSDEAILGAVVGASLRGILVPGGAPNAKWSTVEGAHSVAAIGLLTTKGDVAITAESVDVGPKSEVFRMRVGPLADCGISLEPFAPTHPDFLPPDLVSTPFAIAVGTAEYPPTEIEACPPSVSHAIIREDSLLAIILPAGVRLVAMLDDAIPLNLLLSYRPELVLSSLRRVELRLL